MPYDVRERLAKELLDLLYSSEAPSLEIIVKPMKGDLEELKLFYGGKYFRLYLEKEPLPFEVGDGIKYLFGR